MKTLLRLLVSVFACCASIWVIRLFDLLKFIGIQEIYFSDAIAAVASIIYTIVLYFTVSKPIVNIMTKYAKKIEEWFALMTFLELVLSLAGLAAGLIIANLASLSLWRLPFGNILTLILCIILGEIGFRIGRVQKDNFVKKVEEQGCYTKSKILDTSVIIDGRILDIIKTGFIEGKIIIPNFILEELRHIADSADALKRSRGRLGLDILNQIQSQSIACVEIVDWHSDILTEVDTKLLKMASELDAFIVTNDYNLNKVAEFQKVAVLNINELSNAVKAIVLPGQEMKINVIKDGKEAGQGIAYLNDGTMIVVENGHRFIGEEINVNVTSVLQTAAGRMIFVKPV